MMAVLGLDGQHLGEALVGALIVVKHAVDLFSGKAREKRRRDEFEEFRAEIRAELSAQLAGLDKRIEKLFAFVIGPDGENGIRGDLRKLERRMDDADDRERDRERGDRDRMLHGALDRRTGT